MVNKQQFGIAFSLNYSSTLSEEGWENFTLPIIQLWKRKLTNSSHILKFLFFVLFICDINFPVSTEYNCFFFPSLTPCICCLCLHPLFFFPFPVSKFFVVNECIKMQQIIELLYWHSQCILWFKPEKIDFLLHLFGLTSYLTDMLLEWLENTITHILDRNSSE